MTVLLYGIGIGIGLLFILHFIFDTFNWTIAPGIIFGNPLRKSSFHYTLHLLLLSIFIILCNGYVMTRRIRSTVVI